MEEEKIVESNELDALILKAYELINSSDEKERSEGLNLYLELSEKYPDNTFIQYVLGWYYSEGIGVQHDINKSKMYYQKASDLGNADASFSLAHIFKSEGNPKCISLFEKAIDGGMPNAIFSLGCMYLNGEIADKNLDKAEEYFSKGDNLDIAMCTEYLGTVYKQKKDIKCVKLFERALRNGRYQSAIELANLYWKGEIVKKDRTRARSYYSKSIETNEPACICGYAEWLASTATINNLDPIEETEKLLQKFIENADEFEISIFDKNWLIKTLGNVKNRKDIIVAEYGVIDNLIKKGDSISDDEKRESFEFLERMSDDFSDAALFLGEWHHQHKDKDYLTIFKYFNTAYELGEFYAAKYLMELYWNGQGVEKNQKISRQFYNEAVKKSDYPTINMFAYLLMQEGSDNPENFREGYKIIDNVILHSYNTDAIEHAKKILQHKRVFSFPIELAGAYALLNGSTDDEGIVLVEKNPYKALSRFMQISECEFESASADANSAIATMYFLGKDIPKDNAIAREYASKAARYNDDNAKRVLNAIQTEEAYERDKAREEARNAERSSSLDEDSFDDEPSGGCYVATSIYGSYDCPEVWVLRRYRDKSLSKTVVGRLFIKIYYAVSPSAVKWFGETKIFKKIFRSFLAKFVSRLKKEGFEDSKYNDNKDN